MRLFGERVGSVTLACVIDFDNKEPDEAEQPARDLLDQAAADVTAGQLHTVILRGETAHTLLTYAEQEKADVLVIGTRAWGPSRASFGSVAERVTAQSSIPVLVGGHVALDG